MASRNFRFESFDLDPANRQLRRYGEAVDLNGRYFDALLLLVREQGRLVSKDRFMDEVWRGIPVTDEALTQCIKTLRRQLGDSAARPHFIETIPKHGYRFIAAVDKTAEHAPSSCAFKPDAKPRPWHDFLLLGTAGTLGGGTAGVIGGLLYGFAGASQPLQTGMGAASVLLVLLLVTAVMALIGGAGVSFGIAAALFAPARAWQWTIIGGAGGGLIVGAMVKLIGLDAFNLLFGQSPGDITGAAEGALLGSAVGLATWLSRRHARRIRDSLALAGLIGGGAGLLISLLGGRLMGGSLTLLVRHFPSSRLRLDQIGALLGETGFGPASQMVTTALEGALFSACVVGAMTLARGRQGTKRT